MLMERGIIKLVVNSLAIHSSISISTMYVLKEERMHTSTRIRCMHRYSILKVELRARFEISQLANSD